MFLHFVSPITSSRLPRLQAFETVIPNELTRIRLRIVDGSVHISPPTLPSHLVLSLGDAKISTNLMPDMPRTLMTFELHRVRALAVDSAGDLVEGTPQSSSGHEYWKVSSRI